MKTQLNPNRNVKAINRLANVIEAETYIFRMEEDLNYCKTAGCVAGHAARIWPSIRDNDIERDDMYRPDYAKLAGRLGIDLDELDKITHRCPDGNGVEVPFSRITRRGAVEMLRNFAKTGRIRYLRRLATGSGVDNR